MASAPTPEVKTEKTEKIEQAKLDEYEALLKSVYEAAKASVTIQVAPGTEDPWIIHSIEAGIDLYTRKNSSGSTIHHVRAAGFVEATPEVIEYMFNSVTCRKSWDEHYEGGMDVCRINQSTRIQYITSRSPRPVPGRDLCIITRKEKRDDGSVFVWSASVDAHPPSSSYVRAILNYSGLLISPTKKEKPTSKMIYAFGVDLKSDIPKEYVKVMTLDRAVMPFNGIGKLVRLPAWIANVKRAVEKETRHFTGHDDERRPSISVVDEKRSMRSPMSDLRHTEDLDLPSPISGAEPVVERKISGPSASAPTQATLAAPAMTPGGAPAAPRPAGARTLKEQFLGLQEGLPATPYDGTIINAYDRFQEALDKNPASGWEFVEKKGDIEIHSKQEAGISSPFMRGAAVVPYPADTIHYVWNKLREKWNDTYLKGRVLEVVDKNTFVSYAAFSAPWPVSGRDIVSICRRGPTDGGGWISINTSVQHNKMPKAGEGLVRGTLIFSGLWLQPVSTNPSHTRVVYVVAQNPNGTIPAGAVKKAAMKQPMSIQQVADLIAKSPEEFAQKAKEMIDDEKKAASASGTRPEEKENPLEDFKGYETSRVIDWELYERGSVDAQDFNRTTPFSRYKTFIGVLASTLKFALLGGPAKKEKAPLSARHIAGVLCVKVVGKTARHGPSRKFAESLFLQLSVGEGAQDAKKFPHDFSFRIHDPSDSLIVRAFSPSQDEETKGRLEVGKLSLPVVDLWAPRGKNRKGGAKRGWYKMETKGQNEKSRREIFICLETAYVYSKLADLTAEYYSRHPGFLDPREALEEKEAVGSASPPTPSGPSGPSSFLPPEKRKGQYDSQILVENAYRVLDASEPIRQFLMSLYAILIWKWPFLTGLTLLILIFSTSFPSLFVVALSCIIFTVLAFNAANTHYGRVLEDSIQWRQEELARDEMIMKIVHGIKKREGRFPLDMLESLREIQGKLFSLALTMEKLCGHFDWSVEDSTSATLMFTTLSLIVAVIFPWRIYTVFLAFSLLAWNSNLYKTLRWMAARSLAYWSRRIRMAASVV